MNKKITLLLLVLCGFSLSYAQRTTAVRINEVLPYNVENYVDDYGKKGAWIELFNSSRGTVDLGGCYLTNDQSNPKKYMIPKGDVLTRVKPRQHVIFWADKQPHQGTFHLNFALDTTQVNTIYLFDSNGGTLIDSVIVPACKADQSWARTEDGEGEWAYATKVTPSTNNLIEESNIKIDKFKTNDPIGFGMSLTAMLVVFCALIVLFLVFKSIGRIYASVATFRARKAKGGDRSIKEEDVLVAGEIYAAIAMAIHEANNEVHDLEDTVVTIERVTRNYSPWSSKIYGLRETPTKR